ncbi:MAG: SAM-dependent methyltransferase [Armatimonadota bacterium]
MSDLPTPTGGPEAVPGSFRDPCGHVLVRDGLPFRAVTPLGTEDLALCVSSGLHAELVAAGEVVDFREHDPASFSPWPAGAAKVIEPEPIPFLSWPWEWCFGQWKDAALLVLGLQRKAFAKGMRLKDASAFNVQFLRGRPVWIDTLSFERAPEGEPWPAYGQFCRHFVAPLALMAHRDVSLGRLVQTHLDGIPLDLAAKLLPAKSRLDLGLNLHIRFHAGNERRLASQPSGARPAGGTVSRNGHLGLLDSLISTVRGLDWRAGGTEWGEYHRSTHYGAEAQAVKGEAVQRMVAAAAPEGMVWDLGANDGRYSRLAAAAGFPTIAFDLDPVAVERAWRSARMRPDIPMLPLLLDVTNPSPSVGWDLSERASLLDRGPAGLVMALALVHHLAITHRIPFERIADFLARCAPAAIVEWVPPDDPQAALLLERHRPDRRPAVTIADFRNAFSVRWRIAEEAPLPGSGRIVMRMERRD